MKTFKVPKLANFQLSTKQKQLSPSLHVDHLMPLIFKKYFPKYLKKFMLTSHDHSVLLKVKRTKILQDFEDKYERYQSEKWRIYLKTKMKSVKVADSNRQAPFHFLKRIRLFSNLSNIRVFLGGVSVMANKQQKDFKRAWKRMISLRHVKCLEIINFSISTQNLLLKLDSASRFLHSLKQLRISCDFEGAYGPSVSEMMLNFKNLLKFLTHLRLPTICQPAHYQSFHNLRNRCHHLSNLSFEFSCERYRGQCLTVEIHYLRTLRTFQNLRILNIDIDDIPTLLRDFTLPASIEELRMSFKDFFSKNLMLQLDPRFGQIEGNELEIKKFFEENSILFMFYENFKAAKNLNTLELLFSFASDQKAYQYQSHFSNNILKKCCSLKNITLHYPKNDKQTPNMFMLVYQDSYLSQFFESCEGSSSLETLEVGTNKVWYSKVDLMRFENKFPKLSNLTVTGNFNQDSDDWSAGEFLRQLLSLGGSIQKIKLETFIKRRIGHLVALLLHIKQLKISEKMKIDLIIRFLDPKDLEDLEPSENSFNDGIDKLKEISKVRGVSVKIFVPTVHARLNSFLEKYVKKIDDCELIQYQFRPGSFSFV